MRFISDVYSVVQIYYEVWNIPGLSIIGKKISTQHIANSTRSQAFFNWMCDQENTNAIFLLENITKSTNDKIVYDNVVDGTVKSSSFDGYNVSKATELRPGDTEVLRNGRIYDTSRFIHVPGTEDEYFLVGVAWLHEEELRVFAAYPEMLVVDSKANTNKYKKAFFAGVGVDGAYKNSILFRTWIPFPEKNGICDHKWNFPLVPSLGLFLLHFGGPRAPLKN